MHLKAHKNMLLKTIVLLALLGLYDESLAEVATEGCSIEALKHDASVNRCFDHDDKQMQVIDKDLAPVATNCIISCKQGEGVTYRICDSGGYWEGPVLKCVDIHDANRKIERRRRGLAAQVKSCKKLDPPLNGALAWENWISGNMFRFYCNENYDIPSGKVVTSYYICDSTKGTWTPSDIVPDCTAIDIPHSIRLGNKVRYYSGDCSSEQAQQHIKQEFVSSMNSSGYNVLCRAYPACGVDNVLVECGEVTVSHTCRSNPCLHGATCVNGLNRYVCRCKHGWSGTNCELDILPPSISKCPTNESHYTSTPMVTVSWTEPTFRDPTQASSPQPIHVSSNYQRNEATFPWGEFVIQYVATKPSNGLRSECLFAESVYPFPCEPLVAPDNGAVACNGWNGRFGEVCTVLCQETWDLYPGEDISRLYVCGASGKWSLEMDIGACSEPYIDDGQSDEVRRHYYSGNCDDQRLEIGEKYIEILKASGMSEMCTSWADSCVPEKAKVVCGNNTAA